MTRVGPTWPALPEYLQRWDDGSVRVDGTRTRFETLVTAFQLGDSAEEISANYGRVALNVVYAVIAYYLDNKAAIDSYFAEEDRQAAVFMAELERKFPTKAFRERLLARAGRTLEADPR